MYIHTYSRHDSTCLRILISTTHIYSPASLGYVCPAPALQVCGVLHGEVAVQRGQRHGARGAELDVAGRERPRHLLQQVVPTGGQRNFRQRRTG